MGFSTDLMKGKTCQSKRKGQAPRLDLHVNPRAKLMMSFQALRAILFFHIYRILSQVQACHLHGQPTEGYTPKEN